MPQFRKLPESACEGTSEYGRMRHVSYSLLVKTFGQPHKNNTGKSRVMWVIGFPKGLVATIYDRVWESGYYPPVEKTTEWHIGGSSEDAVFAVKFSIPMPLRDMD